MFIKKLTTKILNWAWVFTLSMLITSIRCISNEQRCPEKRENIDFAYGKDSINIFFIVDSTIEKTNDVISWGYLYRFGYKNTESEIYFSFFSKDVPRISQLPDSMVIQNIKSRFKGIENEGKITKIEKITKPQFFGFLVEYRRSEDIMSIFSGEFTESHLPFSIEVNQNNTRQHTPAILSHIIESLKIRVVPLTE